MPFRGFNKVFYYSYEQGQQVSNKPLNHYLGCLFDEQKSTSFHIKRVVTLAWNKGIFFLKLSIEYGTYKLFDAIQNQSSKKKIIIGCLYKRGYSGDNNLNSALYVHIVGKELGGVSKVVTTVKRQQKHSFI